MDDEDDNVELASSVSTSVGVAAPAPAATPLELPGLPPAAIAALQSPPAGRYIYNCPVYISNSPLAMPSTLQRVLNFEPVEFQLPASLVQPPTDFGTDSPLVVPPESPSHSPLLPYGPTSPSYLHCFVMDPLHRQHQWRLNP